MAAHNLQGWKLSLWKLMLRNLRAKIEAQEREKSGLSPEIQSLIKRDEARAHELENEVAALRKEVKVLEKLLDMREKPGVASVSGGNC